MSRLLAALLTVLAAEAQPAAQEILDRALAAAKESRYEQAATALQEGRRRYPDDARFLQELAGIRYRQGRSGEAKAHLLDALQLNPDDPYANEFLATLYGLEDNLEAALKYWNRVNQPVLTSVQLSPVPDLNPVLRARISAASPGQILTAARYRRTIRNLAELGIFAESRIQLSGTDLTIHTTARRNPGGRWYWRMLPYLRGLMFQQVNADIYNLDREAANLETLLRWDPDKRRIWMSFGRPYGTSRYRFALDVRDERWNLLRAAIPNLRLARMEAGGEALVQASDGVRWITGLWTSTRRIRSSDADLARHGWLLELRNRLEGTLYRAPERRLRVDGWAHLRSGRWVTGDNGSNKFLAMQLGGAAHWLPQAKGEKYELRAQMRAGAMSADAPIDELFILGMERDNDLWLRGHVGTRGGKKGSAPQGSQFVLMNLDFRREALRLPFLRIQAGPFLDAGVVRDPRRNLGSRGLLYDAGVEAIAGTMGGVRFSAIYGRDLRNGGNAFYAAVSR